MVDHTVREQWLRDLPHERLARIAANFARVASCVNERTSEIDLMAILEETETFCQWAVEGSSAETQLLLRNLTTALGTWRQVWPRLGSQQEFRLAVAREADLWSRRLQTSGAGS